MVHPSPPVLPAFSGVAPHLADPSGRWLAWITEPAGVYDVILPGHHVHDDYAAFLTERIVPAVDAVWGTTARLRYVHDWRFASTYSVSVRAKLVKWGVSAYGRERVESVTAILDDNTPALLRMACVAAVSLMAAGGVQMFVRTPPELQFESDLRPVPADRLPAR